MTAPQTIPRPMRVSTYRGSDGKFYWRLVGANGEKFARSQGYTLERHAVRAARRLVEAGRQGIELEQAPT